MRLNAARVQSTSEILTWTPLPALPRPRLPPQPPPPRAVCRSSSVWPCREAAAAPRCTHIKECVFAQACVPDALAYAPPTPHCRRCRISESYFSRSPEVGKWAWRRFLLGSLEPRRRRVASLIPSSPVSPFYSERSEGSVAPALLVVFVLCRRSCNRAALWLIGCLCCVTGLSMKSWE